MIGARFNELVIFMKLRFQYRDGLNADESTDVLPHGPHERLALPQAVNDLAIRAILIVIAGIEVREDAMRFVARGDRHFNHVGDALARLLGGADVLPGRAELTSQRR